MQNVVNVDRDQLSRSCYTAMRMNGMRMKHGLKRCGSPAAQRRGKKVAGQKVFKRPALRLGRLAQTDEDWSKVCSRRHDRLVGAC